MAGKLWLQYSFVSIVIDKCVPDSIPVKIPWLSVIANSKTAARGMFKNVKFLAQFYCRLYSNSIIVST
jgi:hypothetical protein